MGPTAYGPSGEGIYGADGKVISREKRDIPPARKAFVKRWEDDIKRQRDKLNEREFKRMREDMDFAEGYQVDGQTAEASNSYVANLTLRHVNERVSSLYAKNPKAIAKPVEKMDSLLWDGTLESVAPVDKRMAMAMQSGQTPAPEDLAFMMAVEDVLQKRKMIRGVGKTMELLFAHFMHEGIPPFKTSAKQLVRRVETCGVGYVKLGFQRIMQTNNEISQKIADFSDRLAHIEALTADMADQEFTDSDAESEELRQAIAVMQSEKEVITREGLVFDFPEATMIIPGPGTKHIRGFVGCQWIAEEHMVSPEEIEARFKVDVEKEFKVYKDEDSNEEMCRWYEIYDLKSGVVRHLVEGYCDFLEEPKAMGIFMEQGHPYFALTFNNLESRKTCFPPSDVRLIRSMQLEYNRSREGMRKHRIANRPAYVGQKGLLDESDLMKLGNHADSEIIELKTPQGTDVGSVLKAKPTVPIDPALYDTEHLFTDIMRTTGSQQANFGGTSNSTATESSIAENTRMNSVGSNVDDLDDLLTAIARAAGQLMLAEMSIDQVRKVVGEGAVWPEMSRSEIAEEVFLEIKAGSSGAPNQAQELHNFERAAPYIMQIPGIQPKKLGEYVLERLDPGIDINEWMVEGLPSLQAMNSLGWGCAAPRRQRYRPK
jgi:hypothetical protein